MENLVLLVIPGFFLLLFFRLMLIPMRLLYRLGIHGLFGLLCLGLLNTVSGFTGILFPINLVTVLIAGFLGTPGIALMALLALIP